MDKIKAAGICIKINLNEIYGFINSTKGTINQKPKNKAIFNLEYRKITRNRISSIIGPNKPAIKKCSYKLLYDLALFDLGKSISNGYATSRSIKNLIIMKPKINNMNAVILFVRSKLFIALPNFDFTPLSFIIKLKFIHNI